MSFPYPALSSDFSSKSLNPILASYLNIMFHLASYPHIEPSFATQERENFSYPKITTNRSLSRSSRAPKGPSRRPYIPSPIRRRSAHRLLRQRRHHLQTICHTKHTSSTKPLVLAPCWLLSHSFRICTTVSTPISPRTTPNDSPVLNAGQEFSQHDFLDGV
jgi:hypothetical protein